MSMPASVQLTCFFSQSLQVRKVSHESVQERQSRGLLEQDVTGRTNALHDAEPTASKH